MNDFDLLKLNRLYHLIHLQGPPIYPFDATYLESSYGHAVSTDLINWETKAPVFGISSPHNFDDSGIWTMHVIENNSKLWMFYTGLSHQNYFHQKIGLAISEKKDGTSWRRFKSEPILSADPQHYQIDNDMAWRDPFVVYDQENSRWIMYISAKIKNGAQKIRGCIGMATSNNLIDWTVQPPIISPAEFNEMECPVVYKYNDIWYMFVSISDDSKIHTYRAAKPTGPFEYLGSLMSHHNYAPRIIEAPNGETVLLHTVSRRWRHEDNGDFMRGMLAQPKKLTFQNDGVPYLSWYSPLEKYFLSNEIDKGKNGLISILLPRNFNKIKIGIRLTTKNSLKSGLELLLERKYLTLQYMEDNYILESIELNENNYFKEIKILLFGEYIEIYCDNRLLLSTAAYRHFYGNIEAWADKKNIDFSFRPWNKEMNSIYRDDLNNLT